MAAIASNLSFVYAFRLFLVGIIGILWGLSTLHDLRIIANWTDICLIAK